MVNKKAVIFDLNGVFIKSPFLSDRFEKDFGVPIKDFLPVLKEVMVQVRLPNAKSVFSLWKPYFDKWGVTLNEDDLLKYWFGSEGENEEMIFLARELKAQDVKIFILSNNFKERAEYYRKQFPFLEEKLHDIFEKIYYSWETGFVKPDKRAYEIVLMENNLSPEDCIYFDDNEEKVEAGKSLGIESYLFKDADSVRSQLL